MYSERLQILLAPVQRKRLEAEARRRNVSVASLVREAIDARFGGVPPEERARAVEEIQRLAGRFLPPEALDRLAESERDEELDALLDNSRR